MPFPTESLLLAKQGIISFSLKKVNSRAEFVLSHKVRLRVKLKALWQMSYWVQMAWMIPEKLKKRVSYARFLTGLCSMSGNVKQRRLNDFYLTLSAIVPCPL
jgi:hypothetical protein